MFWRLSHEKDKTRFLLQKDMKKIIPKKKEQNETKRKARGVGLFRTNVSPLLLRFTNEL